jgi:peptidoglycan/LPS O-acetylase OafA/YrhL
MENIPKANNFDLLRLVAALQVALNHSAQHLQANSNGGALFEVSSLIPGVPIFFFISGFLISRAFENNPVVNEYSLNRILRIYPALICCLLISVVMVWMTGYFSSVHVPIASLFTWLVAQISIGQFYNPDFLRGYGVGVLNGSVWTITVELQFYLLVPVLYALLALEHTSRVHSNRRLLLLTAVFLLANQAYFLLASAHADDLWYKLAGVTFLPWFYMFLVGVLAQRNFRLLHSWLGGRFLLALIAYCALAWLLSSVVGWNLGNNLNPLLFGALALLTFSAAFSLTGLSDSVLHRNDISYGVYLYHMPVVNLLLALGLGGTSSSLAFAMAATLLLAALSWFVVEKPALRLKRHALYNHSVEPSGIPAARKPG